MYRLLHYAAGQGQHKRTLVWKRLLEPWRAWINCVQKSQRHKWVYVTYHVNDEYSKSVSHFKIRADHWGLPTDKLRHVLNSCLNVSAHPLLLWRVRAASGEMESSCARAALCLLKKWECSRVQLSHAISSNSKKGDLFSGWRAVSQSVRFHRV